MIRGIAQYASIQAIYPPTPGVLPKACCSCGRDVRTNRGFVDTSKPPKQGYLCVRCTLAAIPGFKAHDLLLYAQEKYRNSKGPI